MATQQSNTQNNKGEIEMKNSHVVVNFEDGSECVYRCDQINLEILDGEYWVAVLTLDGEKRKYEISSSEYIRIKSYLTGSRA